jgi:heme oxygenase
MARPTLLRVELETHAYHRDADRPWLALLAPELTRQQYADRLARIYVFEAPLEAALAYTPYVPSLVGMRARSRLLARDLFTLDVPAAKRVPRLIAPFPSVAAALGWLYVIERSARLLDAARSHVRARLPDEPALYLHDPEAPARWDGLASILDRVACSPRVTDDIIHAAHDAFRCLLDWYVSEQPLRRGA